MTLPDDIDDAYELLQRKAVALDAALDAIEAEQAKGRSGYASCLRAQKLLDEFKEFSRVLSARIEEARNTL